jgi:hypothetical protein
MCVRYPRERRASQWGAPASAPTAAMNDILTLSQIGLALALALVMGYEIARWIRRMLILRAAKRIADAYSTEQALASASPFLRHKLERYRLAKLRAALGASRSTHAAATELVVEYRLFSLERR